MSLLIDQSTRLKHVSCFIA